MRNITASSITKNGKPRKEPSHEDIFAHSVRGLWARGDSGKLGIRPLSGGTRWPAPPHRARSPGPGPAAQAGGGEVKEDSELFGRFQAEFTELAKDETRVPFMLTKLELWVIFSQLQLAFRHPQNTGATRSIAEEVGHRLQAIVAPSGALAEVAQMGWEARFDV